MCDREQEGIVVYTIDLGCVENNVVTEFGREEVCADHKRSPPFNGGVAATTLDSTCDGFLTPPKTSTRLDGAGRRYIRALQSVRRCSHLIHSTAQRLHTNATSGSAIGEICKT